MRISKLVLCILFLISFLLPYIAFAHAAKKPGYVGINEGQTIIWNTEFYRGPLEDYYEDRGKTEESAFNNALGDFEANQWKKKSVAWKIYIVEIKGEEEENVLLPTESINDDYDRVKYIYNLYRTKDKEDIDDWKEIQKYETGKIWESDEDLYETLFNTKYGLSSGEPAEHPFPAFIVASDLKWNQVADKHEEEFEDSDKEDYRDVGDVKVQYFFEEKTVGIKSEYDPAYTYPEYKKDLETFETIAKYNDDGILYYYEYTYDGETIAKFELDSIGGVYIIENWWWLSIVGAVILATLSIVVIMIKKKRKR